MAANRKKAKRSTVKPGSQGMNWIRQEKREALYMRAEKALGARLCTYCLTETKKQKRGGQAPNAPTLDHIIPHCLGGKNEPDNLVLCCQRCNKLKRDLPIGKFVELLEALGVNPKRVNARIKAQTKLPIDLEAGKKNLAKRAKK